jgi:hypothetical protein
MMPRTWKALNPPMSPNMARRTRFPKVYLGLVGGGIIWRDWRKTCGVRMFSVSERLASYFRAPVFFSKLESTNFDALVRELDSVRATTLKRQLAAVNRVHRSPDSEEVNLFVIRKGKSDFPPDLCFENRDEFNIGAVDIRAANGVKLQADVWCVHGHIFSIEDQSSASA